MKYRGYDIVKAKHPTPFKPDCEAYDVMMGVRTLKTNLASPELAKMFIDTIIKYDLCGKCG